MIGKWITVLIMFGWGTAQLVIPELDATRGNVWMIGSVLLAWMPTS